MEGIIRVHNFFSQSAGVVWIALVLVSLFRFRKALLPASFPAHRYFGRLGMILMLGAGITAIPLYIYGFVF